jgi:ABC-2 type transport system permease protein
VPRKSLVLGKVLGTAVPLALLLVPAAVRGVAAIALNRGGASLLASGPRLALMAAAYLLYFAVWLAISLAVSARASSSRLALVVLIGLWFVTTLVAPRIVSDLARRAHPAPTAVELAAAIEADKKKLPEWDARVAAIEARLLEQYGVATAAELPVNPQGVALEEGEADDTAVYERNFGSLTAIYERQNRF